MLLKTAPRCELESALGPGAVEPVLGREVAREVRQRADGETALGHTWVEHWEYVLPALL